jgi:single-strand selective monofunctional uracil DNA glycosylase
MDISQHLLTASNELASAVDALSFTFPVTHVYNPLSYARLSHQQYLLRFGGSTKQTVFLGMNPGPFGMAQTGVPFGEIAAVRDWMGIETAIGKPPSENPARPVDGYACPRSEVSGHRLWGLMAERFGEAENFFTDHIVINYCPLVFMEEGGKNVTPDKLKAAERGRLFKACDAHLRKSLDILQPQWAVGIGGFAEQCLQRLNKENPLTAKIGKILHPSPASPAANRGWSEAAIRQLEKQGIW